MKRWTLTALFFFSLAISGFNITYAAVDPLAVEALKSLYVENHGDSWTNNGNWLVGDPCENNWYGVSCSLDFVTGLNLQGNGLDGYLYPEDFENLPHLNYLNLSNNSIKGRIPSALGNLGALTELYLDHNQFIGSIPVEIGNLIDLKYLYLSSNQLSSFIPTSLTNLTPGIVSRSG